MAFGADEIYYDEKTRVYKTKCRSISCGCNNKWFSLNINPVVTIISAGIIWGLVIWCILKPMQAVTEMKPWMFWITDTSTWLYIGTQDVWFFFILVLYFSKYGKMKLGKDDEEPEYSDSSYFAMLFAAGIGIGLFYFGVSEPISHYALGANRYSGRYNDNQRAQDAINVTLFHWGIHGWIVYVVIGLSLAFVGYRWNLPMTIRSCFYPIVGDHIYGWIGDLVDILSVVATMFGVCTSLGFGVESLNEGLNRLNSDIEVNTTNQVIIIWAITAVATVSVISGIKVGIRRLSEICFGLGCFIMCLVLFYDDTWYLANVYVQSIGYYMQYIVQLGFHTDAFAQEDNAPDGIEQPNWMNDWTIFYWGWWIAWSPFVGMFIAKISRGRTIRQFITYTMTLPIIYIFFWFCIFGGIAIRMEREAENAGIQCNSTYGGADSTKPGINSLYRLTCRGSGERWFDVIDQYEGISTFLSVISIIGLVLYFVTSSDSGSLVIDCLSANGHPDPPIIQRIFWACTEGACATALLVAGGSEAMTALQVMSIASGLPYTIVLNFMCIAIWRAVKAEAGDLDLSGPHFSVDILNTFTSFRRIPKLLLCILAPWFFMSRAYGRINKTKPYLTMVVLATLFYAVIALEIAEVWKQGLAPIGWTLYIGFALYGSSIRTQIREAYKINGNMIEDVFAVLILYPLAVFQMDQHLIDSDDFQLETITEHNTEIILNSMNVNKLNTTVQPIEKELEQKAEPIANNNVIYYVDNARESAQL